MRLPPIGWDGGSCLVQYCLKPFMPRLELAEFLPARLKIETCLFARRVAREEQLIITLARHKHGAGGSRGHGAYPYCPAIAPAAAGLNSRMTAASRTGDRKSTRLNSSH